MGAWQFSIHLSSNSQHFQEHDYNKSQGHRGQGKLYRKDKHFIDCFINSNVLYHWSLSMHCSNQRKSENIGTWFMLSVAKFNSLFYSVFRVFPPIIQYLLLVKIMKLFCSSWNLYKVNLSVNLNLLSISLLY